MRAIERVGELVNATDKLIQNKLRKKKKSLLKYINRHHHLNALLCREKRKFSPFITSQSAMYDGEVCEEAQKSSVKYFLKINWAFHIKH